MTEPLRSVFQISGAALAARQRPMGSTLREEVLEMRSDRAVRREVRSARFTVADHDAPDDVPHSRVFAQLALPAGMALTM
jgi:hypothetical protein